MTKLFPDFKVSGFDVILRFNTLSEKLQGKLSFLVTNATHAMPAWMTLWKTKMMLGHKFFTGSELKSGGQNQSV